MTIKNKIYLSTSFLVFFITMFTILTSNESAGMLNNSLSIHWMVLFAVALLLPILNIVEIISNKEDWNKFYWLGLAFNILTIIFIMRYFKIELISNS